MKKWLIGIDEAGRGPLAGPVSVGVVCVRSDFDWDVIPGVNDSKKLSEKKREVIYTQTLILHKQQRLTCAVGMVGATVIDRIGIVGAIREAMRSALDDIFEKNELLPEDCLVKLDGSLKAPSVFVHQETIIKGDAKEKVIGLASIAAKVTRDRYMSELAHQNAYAAYGFDRHKGYGTKAHCDSIRALGLCDIHRKSFCSKLI